MCDDFSLPQTSWIALLSIAHRYDFSNVRKRAIREIFHPQGAAQQQSQDHVILLLVGERYHVPHEDLVPSLIVLVMRSQSLTEDEVTHLSALTVSRLARAREEFVRKTANPQPVGSLGASAHTVGPYSFGARPVGMFGANTVGASPSPVLRDDIAKSIVGEIWRD
jgi:hypothetical protein